MVNQDQIETIKEAIEKLLSKKSPRDFDEIVDIFWGEQAPDPMKRSNMEVVLDGLLNQMADTGTIDYDRFGLIFLKAK